MREYGCSLTRIFPYKDKIVENTGQRKPVFLHILYSATIIAYSALSCYCFSLLFLVGKQIFQQPLKVSVAKNCDKRYEN